MHAARCPSPTSCSPPRGEFAPSIAAFLGEAQETLAQHLARVPAVDRRAFGWLIGRPEKPQMPRQCVERRLLVVKPQARALAVRAGRLDIGDRASLPITQMLLGPQRHAAGAP